MNTRLALATIPATLALLLTGCAQAGPAMDKPSASASAMEKEPSPAMESSPAMGMESSPAMGMESSPAMEEGGSMGKAGAYITFADYQAKKAEYAGKPLVYFFHASWCPDCKAADTALTAPNVAIPAGVTIVKVDYDTATDLKRTYGVTTQHTFVQVDGTGKAVQKWSGKTVEMILAELKA